MAGQGATNYELAVESVLARSLDGVSQTPWIWWVTGADQLRHQQIETGARNVKITAKNRFVLSIFEEFTLEILQLVLKLTE